MGRREPKFMVGDEVRISDPLVSQAGKKGTITRVFSFYSEEPMGEEPMYAVMVGKLPWHFSESQLGFLHSESYHVNRGETHMMPDGTMVNPDKIFVKGRGLDFYGQIEENGVKE